MENFIITKASGEKVTYSSQKLRKSLERSGANTETISAIIKEVESRLYNGITSKKIYRIAFELLKKYSKPVAAKYKLKQAIMELGPSGYPFEKFIAEIMKYQGFQIKVGKIVSGSCVNHEIDVIAEKDEKHFMVECKYHNRRGTICDVKIPLYIQARFKDVEQEWKNLPGHGTKFHQGWVVTNTRFSDDAIQYGTCAGLHLVGWDFPKQGSLKEQIDVSGLYPITCLNTLTLGDKQQLLDHKIVLCKEICDNPNLLSENGINAKRIGPILKEAQLLCEGGKL
ncbi:MAG: ATPase [Bacteroidetes bacterium RIFCSPLOWO2_12_FULL_35_15]|nr:MAG: ATPase [Bacteroidetes bacterium RIFCSPLOWO2_12_FULL_35_15]